MQKRIETVIKDVNCLRWNIEDSEKGMHKKTDQSTE